MPKRFGSACALCAFLLCLLFAGNIDSRSPNVFAGESSASSEAATHRGTAAGAGGDAPKAENSGSAALSGGGAPAGEDTKRIEKWIPDQKILAGAPPTVISLSDVIGHFQEEGAFGVDGWPEMRHNRVG